MRVYRITRHVAITKFHNIPSNVQSIWHCIDNWRYQCPAYTGIPFGANLTKTELWEKWIGRVCSGKPGPQNKGPLCSDAGVNCKQRDTGNTMFCRVQAIVRKKKIKFKLYTHFKRINKKCIYMCVLPCRHTLGYFFQFILLFQRYYKQRATNENSKNIPALYVRA